uniref:Uncharacterized protein n=1 Tax=Aegilops tauschii subsp. strangulata TaxID=200361 RepID=A0A453IBQ2_AEGTS
YILLPPRDGNAFGLPAPRESSLLRSTRIRVRRRRLSVTGACRAGMQAAGEAAWSPAVRGRGDLMAWAHARQWLAARDATREARAQAGPGPDRAPRPAASSCPHVPTCRPARQQGEKDYINEKKRKLITRSDFPCPVFTASINIKLTASQKIY